MSGRADNAMTNMESAVARHYGVTDLLGRIYAGLEAAGADLARLDLEDLAPVDEFHIGGRKATVHAVGKLSPGANDHVLDIGCGIGGAARYLASQAGCRVTGIDLTPEFVATAQALTEKTGLGGRVAYEVASALDMPFADGAFDGAITLHVAMNIRDRAGLYGEVARVIKPGATFCLYDVMKRGEVAVAYPVPWAEGADTSHLTTPDEMLELLDASGLEVFEVEDRTDFAREFFRQTLAAVGDGPPPLGLNLLMGATAPVKFRNMLDNVENGRIAVVQMLARRGV